MTQLDVEVEIRIGRIKYDKLLAADSSSISPNVVVVCLLFVCCVQVRKMLAKCLLTAC